MRVDPARLSRYGRAGARWARLLASGTARPGLRVFYGHDRVPLEGERVAGGTAKIQKLAERFPNSPTDFSLLYLGSNCLPRDLGPLLWLAQRRGAPIVVNQDGVAYPGWAGERTDEINARLHRLLTSADHVVYQSEFSKRSADLFAGEPRGSSEILPNAVDVDCFTPGEPPRAGGPVMLLGGDQTQVYRLELGLRTLAALSARHPAAQLLVTGRLVASPEQLMDELGVRGRVHLLGEYTQRDAPAVFRRAHLLLHTKVNDPCPTVVVEAMACGLPVVYPSSGGTVELVGDEAGIGVEHGGGWDRDDPPNPDALADAVERVLGERASFSEAARRRAVERFSLGPWLDRHAALFSELLERLR